MYIVFLSIRYICLLELVYCKRKIKVLNKKLINLKNSVYTETNIFCQKLFYYFYYLWGLAPPLCVLRNTPTSFATDVTPPLLLRPKEVLRLKRVPLGIVLPQRSYILDKLGYASRKANILALIL